MSSVKIFTIPEDVRGSLDTIIRGNSRIEKVVLGAALAVVLYNLSGREKTNIRLLEENGFSYTSLVPHDSIRLRSLLNTLLKSAGNMSREEESGEAVALFNQKDYREELTNGDFLTIGVENKRLICSFTDSISSEDIDTYIEYIYRVVNEIRRDSTILIKDTLLFTESERRDYFEKWQGEKRDIPEGHIADLFEKSFRKYRSRIAVCSEEESLTYEELYNYSLSIASELQKRGVKESDRVGVLCSQKIETIASVVAIAAVGGVYVPLDARAPVERRNFILRESGVNCLINTGGVRSDNYSVPVVDAVSCRGKEGVVKTELKGKPDSYIVYTSGTTGTPKGTVISEEFLKNLCYWYIDAFSIDENSRIIQLNSFGFDASVKNIYSPLLMGGAIVMGPEELYDTFGIARIVEQLEVTHINCVPVLFNALLETVRYSSYRELDQVKYVILGGDVFEREKIVNWCRLNRCQAAFGNVYGPTESTSVSVWHSFSKEELLAMDKVPLGRPVYNKRAYVLNNLKKICPPGVKGTLWLGGTGTVNTYINPERNGNRFSKDPFGDAEVLYNTGDIVWFDESGVLRFAGREDNQIKINGQRVELEEIEGILKAYPGIREGVVIKKQTGLVGFYTLSDGGKAPDDSEITAFMEKHINRAVVPYRFVLMKSIELNANGKPHRSALESVELTSPELPESEEKSYSGEEGDLTTKLIRAWKTTLAADSVAPGSSFFEQGGTSIMLFKLKQEIHKETGFTVEMVDILNYPSVDKIRDWLLQKKTPAEDIRKQFEEIAAKRRRVAGRRRGRVQFDV